MKAKLKDGFELEIIEDNLGDWEFLELLSDIDEGETGLIVKAARMMLGKEGVKALKDHIRNEQGKVPAEAMIYALQEILESASELKNL